jgi:quercetin dioxygenase-like cupin family protein
MTLPIGLGPALTHHHEGEELATVLSGVVEVRIEDETHVLREGDSLHFRGERSHSYVNPASNPAVVLVANRTRAGF